MDDMFSKISELLDDPVQAEKIKNIANSLMSGKEEKHQTPSDTTQPPISSQSKESSDMVSSLLGFAGGGDIFGKLAVSSDKMKRNVTLLHAISPYMRPSRAAKIASAVKIIQILEVISKAR